jgi:hypothetical protein
MTLFINWTEPMAKDFRVFTDGCLTKMCDTSPGSVILLLSQSASAYSVSGPEWFVRQQWRCRWRAIIISIGETQHMSATYVVLVVVRITLSIQQSLQLVRGAIRRAVLD